MKEAFLTTLFIVIRFGDSESAGSWYDGCFRRFHNSTFLADVTSVAHVADCATSCLENGVKSFGVQNGTRLHCMCLYRLSDFIETTDDFCNSSCGVKSDPCIFQGGATDDTWAVYSYQGPELTKVELRVDARWIIINTPVAIETLVDVAGLENHTDDMLFEGVGRQLQVSWWFHKRNNTDKVTSLELSGEAQVRVRTQAAFSEVGNRRVGVRVSNGASTLTSELDISIQLPIPRQLQVDIPEFLTDQPSCIPQSFDVTESDGPVFSVFVNTTVPIEASVAVGTNLTFDFWFAETGTVDRIEPCEGQRRDHRKCTSIIQEHKFTDAGIYDLFVAVSNLYGSLQENVTLVVVERKLSDLVLSVHSEVTVVPLLEPIYFLVSMVTTSRNHTYLKITFGDGLSHVVSLKDTNTSEVVLLGDGEDRRGHRGDMEVVASYGEGCRLLVQFQYAYSAVGVHHPAATVFTNGTDSSLNDEFQLETSLDKEILVLPELRNLRLQADRVSLCHKSAHFRLHPFASTLNMSVTWTIRSSFDNEIVENVTKLSNSSLLFSHKFEFSGAYLLTATAWNAVSRQILSTNILVQCPIRGLDISCSKQFLRIGELFSCEAHVQQGTDIVFKWTIEGQIEYNFTMYENSSSTILHQFTLPGFYDITVEARNEIDFTRMYLEEPLIVQRPVSDVQFGSFSPFTLQGAVTEFHIVHESDVQIKFHFGHNCTNLKNVSVISEDYTVYRYINCTFLDPGRQEVTISASNKVSEINRTVEVLVVERLDSIHVDVISIPVAGIRTMFAITRNGSVIDTENVFFQWRFGVGPQAQTSAYTRSPLAEFTFNQTGSHIVNLYATNPVTNATRTLFVTVEDVSEVNLLLTHETIVALGDNVIFSLKGPLIGWSELVVSYSDGTEDRFLGVRYMWQHQFLKVGVSEIKVTLIGLEENETEVISSYIMVEEPITGMKLEGPTVVMYDRFNEEEWFVTMETGSHVMYVWELGAWEPIVMTSPKLSLSVNDLGQVGPVNLSVCVHNDVSPPISSQLTVNIQFPILDIEINVIGQVVSKDTVINVAVSGANDFCIDVDFGDGVYDSTCFLDDDFQILREFNQEDLEFVVPIRHTFTDTGTFNISVTVSNDVSYFNRWQVFQPIKGVHLSTESPRVVSTSDDVVIKATVESGKGLNFKWIISDEKYNEPSVVNLGNNTSMATHSFSTYGEYHVSVNVTNDHYPLGVTASLPFNFTAVDEITDVIMPDIPQGAQLLPPSYNSTEVVKFEARSTGSHCSYVFDFGDGMLSEEVSGEYLPYLYIMRMKGVVSHRYMSEGVYIVRALVRNPLGNMTVVKKTPFHVQKPPENLTLELPGMLHRCYIFCPVKFGENTTFNASVSSGTNVTFTWKLGDETDLIDTGPVVTHKYLTAGEKDVHVTAKNQVAQLSEYVKLRVEHLIQGVELRADKTLVTVNVENIKFTAVVDPVSIYNETYCWDFEEFKPEKCSENSIFAYRFTTSGWFTVVVVAKNSVSNATSNPVEIHSVARISNLKIFVDSKALLVNQSVVFYGDYYEGSEITYVWSFGDGSPEVVTDKTRVEHTYIRSSEYIVTLTAKNLVSNETDSKKLFILEKPYCEQPDVDIVGDDLRQEYQSKPLMLEAHVENINCNLTSTLTFIWGIFSQYGQQVHVQNVSKMELSRRVLMLPPRSLMYGVYMVKLRVQMQDTIVYSTSERKVEVIPSPLVPIIDGGILRRVARTDIITVSGSSSYDPDFPDNQNLSFHWTCISKGYGQHFGRPCFQDNSTSLVAMDTATLTFPGNYLLEGIEFKFDLRVSLPGRGNASTFQVIEVYEEKKVASIRISCPLCDAGLVNSNEKLTFQAVYDDCVEGKNRYEWTLLQVFGTNLNEFYYDPVRAHDSGRCVNADGSSYLSIKAKNVTTTIKPLEDTVMSTTMKTTTERAGEESDDQNSGRSSRVDRNQLPLPNQLPIPEEHHPSSGRDGPLPHPNQMPVPEEGNVPRRMNSGRKTFPQFGTISEWSSGGRKLPNRDLGDSSSRRGRGQLGSPVENESTSGRQRTDYGSGNDHDPGREAVQAGKQSIGKPDPPRLLSVLELQNFEVSLSPEDTRTGLDRESLVIKPGVLEQGHMYLMQLKVVNEDGAVVGHAKTTFTVNKSPSKGTCNLNPDDGGIEIETEFKALCKAWRDNEEHKPLLYEVSYNLKETDKKTLIYQGLAPSVKFKLPAGDPDNDYSVFVYITILDKLRARTPVCYIKVAVLPRRFGQIQEVLTQAQSIHEEVTSPTGLLSSALGQGDERLARVYVGYLATRLNQASRHNRTVLEEEVQREGQIAAEYNRKSRMALLERLAAMPVRDQSELLQTAQALSYTTAEVDQLNHRALGLSVKVLKSIVEGAKTVYGQTRLPMDDLVDLTFKSTSSVLRATTDMAKTINPDTEMVYGLKYMVHKSMEVVEELLQTEMRFHTIFEEPVQTSSYFLSTLASRQTCSGSHMIQIDQSKFILPPNMDIILKRNQSSVCVPGTSANWNCFQSHMTMFKSNPFSFGPFDKVHSHVSSLSLYKCDGQPIQIKDLKKSELLKVEIPHPMEQISTNQTLKKWEMNTHQFNVSAANFKHALHIVIDLVPMNEGRLFPITVFISKAGVAEKFSPHLLQSFQKSPSNDNYLYQQVFNPSDQVLKIFLPPGSLNVSGVHFLNIVDANYNAGRPREGEVTVRNYTLKLWWDECLYWDSVAEEWSSEGCWLADTSSYDVTQCRCSHLTSFGSHFELIPNELSFTDIEALFSPHKNPTPIILIGIIAFLYFVFLLFCRQADLYDAKKGGIVYLLDNSPGDQQKYEVTVETGFRRGAGTSAKISIILHGEEGMSETRELISEDQRPMFERNSRDKFILTLPDSIGRIWKVQLWHNNFGSSPSWYLSRVTVRDLNSGSMYYFVCEKWLAVEKEDGKVEREFLVLEGGLGFKQAFWTKEIEYMTDFHTWVSVFVRPSYSGFMRTERLTCCLTLLMMYMCLNAMWYQRSETEYRGEFGLLDVSLRTVAVGAICCGIVLPVHFLLDFLFRRSKPRHVSTCQGTVVDEEKDRDYPSGKPNEQESEYSGDHVPPVMTYSILDQSILNWPSIQSWAQKQWVKRQQSVVGTDSHSGNSVQSHQSGHDGKPLVVETEVEKKLLSAEIDQASSGFEDSSSLIRPQASADSTRTTAAPSVAESMKTHKPPSLTDSLRTSKPTTISEIKTNKASSISSSGSQKSSVSMERREPVTSHIYLPFWCRYLAWTLCILICLGCATVTLMYAFRFGPTKSMMWLQSLYFSFMMCVFISHPVLILLAVVMSAMRYRQDPSILNHDDIFNREKANEDFRKWKKTIESYDEAEALERSIAARQRSRYLRFARPPQEKQLIEARKRILKEKKALNFLWDSGSFIFFVLLLTVMAYGKNTESQFHLNDALIKNFVRYGNPDFLSLKDRADWFTWINSTFMTALYEETERNQSQTYKNYILHGSSYLIGNVHIRQLRVRSEPCLIPSNLPYVNITCRHDYSTSTMMSQAFGDNGTWHHGNSSQDTLIYGIHSFYDSSGFTVKLNKSRSEAFSQLMVLQSGKWLDLHTRAVVIEFTVYNAPTNLFSSVVLLMEFSPTGGAFPSARVMSTYLFKYVTKWDNFLLACELMFFVLMMYKIKQQLTEAIKLRKAYFINGWNILEIVMWIISLGFCVCYIYRFVLVARIVERLRSTYYEEFVDMSLIAFWDEMLRSAVSIVLFLSIIKCLRLLRYNKLCAVFGQVYRKAHRDLLVFLGLFVVILCAYTSLGRAMFGATTATFRDLWTSLLGMSALLTREGVYPEFLDMERLYMARVFVFTFCVFGLGLLTSCMVAILSHHFKSRKGRKLLAMGSKEALRFYWEKLLICCGLKKCEIVQEPECILPPEFTMAEIEYQVDELLFRMNALSGSHGLPDKPPIYMTDSDGTYGAGDDGISSGGSEVLAPYGEDRLEQRVQKIEDNLCSQEPFLAQLLKLDSIGADNLSQEKEKQLRSHLELEIFRQLQMQRQESEPPSTGQETENKGDETDSLKTAPPSGSAKSSPLSSGENTRQISIDVPKSPGKESTNSTSSDEVQNKSGSDSKSQVKVHNSRFVLPEKKESTVAMETSSTSNPESPKDKQPTTAKVKPAIPPKPKLVQDKNSVAVVTDKGSKSSPKSKGGKLFSLEEKGSPSSSDTSKPHDRDIPVAIATDSNDPVRRVLRKPEPPVKPTFLQAALRDLPVDATRLGSPLLKLRPGVAGEKLGNRSDNSASMTTESSSGSEQDGFHCSRKQIGKRNLRKTKSRGKGKGPDSLAPSLLLDELDIENLEESNDENCDNPETIPEQEVGE